MRVCRVLARGVETVDGRRTAQSNGVHGARQLDRAFKTRMHCAVHDSLYQPTLLPYWARLHARRRVYFFITLRELLL